MTSVTKLFTAVAMLLSAVCSAQPSEPKQVEIRKHDRVLCIKDGCQIKSESSGLAYSVPFGALLKVSKIDGEKCLVYNDFNDGWGDLSNFVSLSEQRVPAIVERSSSTQARKK